MKQTLVALFVVLLAGCGGSGSFVPGQSTAAGMRDAAAGATALPGTGAGALPGTGATALPGNGATALPGAQFACGPMGPGGSATCSLAININVPPLSNPNALPSEITGYQPSDLQRAYGFPAGAPGGVVAIVDAFDDAFAESDLAVYRSAFGLPPCISANGCFTKLSQRGTTGYPQPDSGWAQEIALDLDMVSAACPRCKIVLIESDSASLDDLGAGVDEAAALGASAISNSYYASEWNGESSEDVHYRHPGIAITASSGDRSIPSYPAVSQYVTAVGGTSSLTGAAEKPWPYTGHGCSAYVAKPSWQSVAPCSTRSGVDVAMVADPQTGVAMFDSQAGGWLVAGGTSVGAPLVAAAYALSANPAGPAFSYAHASAFHDLAAPYDQTTGLGSPYGIAGL